MLYGYLKLWLTGAPTLVTPAEASVYRKMQHFRLLGWITIRKRNSAPLIR